MDDDIPPGDPTDTTSNVPGNNSNLPAIRTWQNSDYADFFISALGFYVATLGIKATTENTVALAKKFFILLLIVGSGWISYYYYLNVQAEEHLNNINNNNKDGTNPNGNNTNNKNNDLPEEHADMSNADLYISAFISMLLPILVWGLCFLRAFQFSRLLQEAQREAEERALLEISNNNNNNNNLTTSNDEEMANNNDSINTTTTNELPLPIEGRIIT